MVDFLKSALSRILKCKCRANPDEDVKQERSFRLPYREANTLSPLCVIVKQMCCYGLFLLQIISSSHLQPVSAILMDPYLKSAVRRLDSASAEKMWSDDSVTSAWQVF